MSQDATSEWNVRQKLWTESGSLRPDPIADIAHEFILRVHEHEEDMSRLAAEPAPAELKAEYMQQASIALTMNRYFRRLQYGLDIDAPALFVKRSFEALLTWRKAHPELDRNNPLAERMAATLEAAQAVQFFEGFQAAQETKNAGGDSRQAPPSRSR